MDEMPSGLRTRDVLGRKYRVLSVPSGAPPQGWEEPDGVEGVEVAGKGRVRLADWLPNAVETLRLLRAPNASVVEWQRGSLGCLEVLELGSASGARGSSGPDSLLYLSVPDIPAWWRESHLLKLKHLHLSRFSGDSMRVLDGLAELRSIKFVGVRQVLALDWQDPPAQLETALFAYLRLRDAAGLAPLARLESLEAYLATPVEDREFDVSPMAQCEELRWVDVSRQGVLTGLERLRSLEHLQSFTVRRSAVRGLDTSDPRFVVK